MKNRVAWGLAVLLAVVVVVLLGGSVLFLRFRPYLVARYSGIGANLYRAPLQGAPLAGVNLQRAFLGGADLQGADLRGANLRDSALDGADLQGADLADADLTNASLGGGAYLWNGPHRTIRYTNLRGADLRGTDLTGTYLAATRKKLGPLGHIIVAHGADITGARYDVHTRWPSGFDPARHGAVRTDH
jgi:hypothetical protein